MSWRHLLKYRQVWAIVISRFLTDPVWWLYITWLPLYLSEVRGFSLKQIGMFAWVPYAAADAGSLLGGWASGFLMARGLSTNAARKTVMPAGALLMLAGIPAALATSAMSALAFISVVTFGFQAWINNVQTTPSDFFPEHAVASVAGLGGVGAGLGAILFTLTTGLVVDAPFVRADPDHRRPAARAGHHRLFPARREIRRCSRRGMGCDGWHPAAGGGDPGKRGYRP